LSEWQSISNDFPSAKEAEDVPRARKKLSFQEKRMLRDEEVAWMRTKKGGKKDGGETNLSPCQTRRTRMQEYAVNLNQRWVSGENRGS